MTQAVSAPLDLLLKSGLAISPPVSQDGNRAARVKAPVARPRLHRSDWIMAGFAALARGGPEALRVEAIARDLGATKGSFYWHFKDLKDLHKAMLEAWESLASSSITGGLRRSGLAPRDRVLALADLVAAQTRAEAGQPAMEPAVRDWARSNPLARETLARVDARRLAELAHFLASAGLDGAQASQGAVRFYAALIGLEALHLSSGVDMGGALRAVAGAILGPPG